MMKKILTIVVSIFGLSLFAAPVFAHVIVHPSSVGIAATQDFSVSVPNEKNNPVVSVRLLIPKGLTSVTPNATPGWTIATKTVGSSDNATVSEIDWTNGSIPVGQRAEFAFEAQVPAKSTILAWKAYQTYSDGTVVSWDINPDTMKNLSDEQQDMLADKENKGEYSTTQVINDLNGNNMERNNTTASDSGKFALDLSIVSLVLSGTAIVMAFAKRKLHN